MLDIKGPNSAGGYEVRLYAYTAKGHVMRWTRVPPYEFKRDGVLRGIVRVYRAALLWSAK